MPRRSERPCEPPAQPRASSPRRRERSTYSRLIPDSGWGDILGWVTGGGWGIRFSSSISSLEGVERCEIRVKNSMRAGIFSLMVWEGMYFFRGVKIRDPGGQQRWPLPHRLSASGAGLWNGQLRGRISPGGNGHRCLQALWPSWSHVRNFRKVPTSLF